MALFLTSTLLSLATFFTVFSAAAKQSSYITNLKNMNFDQLSAHNDIAFEGDQIWFKGTAVSMLNTCMSDSKTLRTNEKKTIEILDEEDLIITGFDYLYTPISTTKAIVNGDTVIYTKNQIKTQKDIYIVTNDDDMDSDFLFSKQFTVPYC
ncbi:hypothetical protein [Pseudoalteromonas denitrificans]|uniref:Organic solvent tolerance-like N-terminal domain-containing protein n=1 Tax=Pseudoalteromonas denitrificans DSM 6059 TaxID=1123010 RepID=A0A1I1RG08_9GAMM|nr:hypothetical protein [Pseudoalteromonas denitrificans]SFD33057.1 hypothetical protein SAMN02745724_04222 [Pseudoalteromonas denitrificans DSM 6059]